MDEIKILHMFPALLNLYGDSGNMEVLKYRCAMRNIRCTVDEYNIDSDITDFSGYDLIYLGGGADLEQNAISGGLMKNKEEIFKAHAAGAFLLLICGGYQLMGKFYRDSNGIEIPGLGLFDYYTTASREKSSRCIGNIIVEAEIDGVSTKIIGFENHGGMTENVKTPLGKVLYGFGNTEKSGYEGYFEKNVIATYLHGPLLSKNPAVADYIIKYCLNRKKSQPAELVPLDDTIENKCREMLLERLLKSNEKD